MPLTPCTPEELAEALGSATADGRTMRLTGRDSKRNMAGPNAPADVEISTCALTQVRKYEPGDLTISVEAGMPYVELAALLAGHGQMLPLDPPFAGEGTVGGVVAANLSGPRRRLYGTARDFVIGMRLATAEGKLVETGGMVVKNVAGLDISKLLIGSFGTLAAMVSVNFKLAPAPPETRSFAFEFPTLEEALIRRDAILASVLQPSAIDLLSPEAARRAGLDGFVIALQAGGNEGVIRRYTKELAGARVLEGDEEGAFWTDIREFTPRFLADTPSGVVVRTPVAVSRMGSVIPSGRPAVARAGSGVVYSYFENAAAAAEWLKGKRGVIEFAPESDKDGRELWCAPSGDFELMQRLKRLFDPQNLLNRGRLYGRI
ncbi:MAG TPA: FAD-binding protein [Bryobacteraceae bacterium]|nr:FAD-binding protein [Bryobacteraceae bacterium]